MEKVGITRRRGSRGRVARPLRTCLGCRQRELKSGLLRLVIVGERVVIDETGKLSGRGGYLHPTRGCAEGFARRGGFVRSFRCVVQKQQRAKVAAEIAWRLDVL